MEKKNIVKFLFVSLALLIAVMLFESGITGMSVAEFSQTTSGASMFSGILLFAFILGILIFVESGNLENRVENADPNAIAEGNGVPLKTRQADMDQLIRKLKYSWAHDKGLPGKKHPAYDREKDPDYVAAREDRLRLAAEKIKERRYQDEHKGSPKGKDYSEDDKKSFMQSLLGLFSYKK